MDVYVNSQIRWRDLLLYPPDFCSNHLERSLYTRDTKFPSRLLGGCPGCLAPQFGSACNGFFLPVDAEKEKQLFSPSTKKVIEEIALTAAMDKKTMLPCPTTKRGIVFTAISGENQDVLLTQVVPSPAEKTDAPVLGSQSPVKKLKNKQSEQQPSH